ncbi:MAG: hypothetical protein HKL92_07690 [Candidatus Eremiobacteraeota bacterium]|nr:hypothetical protein [Candidatus Eremiobacteraeota bacterium]
MNEIEQPIDLFRNARALCSARQFEAAAAAYLRCIALVPDFAIAHMRYAELLMQLGHADAALAEMRAGFRPVSGQVAPFRGSGEPIRILQLGSSSVQGQTGTDAILDPQLFETTTILVQYWDPERTLPTHDIAFNLIADPDIDAPALAIANALLAPDFAPVLNAPSLIAATSRVAHPLRLQAIPDTIAPLARLLPRREIDAGQLPFLLRSPGYHNGAHFELITTEAELASAIATLPGEKLLQIEYIETADRDGRIRKYRAMIVDGIPYPAHLAIARHWNIHYFSAEMGAAERAEEIAYLSDLRAHLGDRVTNALVAVGHSTGLDYLGIDFSISRDGRLVVFEANAAMTVFLPEENAGASERRAAALHIFEATKKMIAERVANRRSR